MNTLILDYSFAVLLRSEFGSFIANLFMMVLDYFYSMMWFCLTVIVRILFNK